jgi:NAD(P)-dependent dehydrogenase (short-subunit alcohol dehydrogenase family)
MEAANTMFPALDLTGKVAVVIGGTSGIGKTLSLGLADAGANVVATGRNAANVDAVAQELEARGRRTLRVTADTRDKGSLQRLLAACLERFEKVEVLLNCAGKIKRAPTLDFQESDWNDILDTNLTGTLRACQVFGQHMLSRKNGRIINIASLNSFVALHEVAAYAASKAGVAALTRALHIAECGPAGQYAARQ